MHVQSSIPAANNAVITFDTCGVIESVNRQAETLFGYTANELAHQHIGILLPAGYTALADDLSLPTLDRQQLPILQQGIQILATRKDQTLLLVNIKFDRVLSNGGITFRAVIEDLATQAIIPQNPLGVLQHSDQQIVVFDAMSLFFISASSGTLANLQYSMDELRTRTPLDIAVNLSVTELEKNVAVAANGKQCVEVGLRMQRKDGSDFEGVMHLQPTQIGTTPACIGLIHSFQRVPQSQAFASSSFSDKLISTLQGIVLLLDKEARILRCNPYFEKLSGYSADELDGVDWFETFIAQEQRADMRRYFNGVFKSGGNDGHVNEIILKDGSLRQVQWHSSTLTDSNGHGMGLLCTGYDVTEQLQNTTNLEQTIKMTEQATQGKSRFLAAASHDLRQPLQSLGMYLAVLNAKTDDPVLLEITTKMDQSLTTMRELMEALLDVSRFDSGAVKADVQNFELQPLLDRIVTDNIQQAHLKSLRLFTEQHNFVVKSDPGLLERVLENLVANATRYTDKGEVKICCTESNNLIDISVCDTGVGIPAEHLEHVFDEYFQLENANGKKNKGLGLGLAIVRHIADLLGHQLKISSEVGKGSKFTISVPVGEIELHEGSASPHNQLENNSPLVLFVDDDPSIVDATLMLLESERVNVLTASDGDAALAHIMNGAQPDMLITDFHLPGYNGIELVKRLRQNLKRDLPAILMTGDTSAQEIVRAQLSNCKLLHKPVDTTDLLDLIHATTPN